MWLRVGWGAGVVETMGRLAPAVTPEVQAALGGKNSVLAGAALDDFTNHVFAMWEYPKMFVAELRAAFGAVR